VGGVGGQGSDSELTEQPANPICHVDCGNFLSPAPATGAGRCQWALIHRQEMAAITAGQLCKFPRGFCSPLPPRELDRECPEDKRLVLRNTMVKIG